MAIKTKNDERIFRKKATTHLCVVVDRSFSMGSVEEEMSFGLTKYLREQAANKTNRCFLTLIEFNSEVEVAASNLDLNEFDSYRLEPRGMTALYDAVSYGIDRVALYSLESQVIFVVVTDGFENSSRHTSLSGLQRQIAEKERLGWEFVFLGAGLDVAKQGYSIGFDPSRVASYNMNPASIANTYETISSMTHAARAGSQSMTFTDKDRKKIAAEDGTDVTTHSRSH